MITISPKNILYVYALTNDSGVAPCVSGRLLSLACCKGGKSGGMRKSIHEHLKLGHHVWILALCSKGLADSFQTDPYSPVYLARINAQDMLMTNYFMDNKYRNRMDHSWYHVKDGMLLPTDKNGHGPDDQARDIGGTYVLFSHEFVYWGNSCGTSGEEIRTAYPYIFHTQPGQEKKGIDVHSRGYIIYDDFDDPYVTFANCPWMFATGKCKILGNKGINQEYIYNANENDDTIYRCSCSKHL